MRRESVFRRWRSRARRLLRRAFGQQESASRIARGAAAGCLAAAVPLPGLQIPLSILLAWLARGNKVVALLPQFLSNAGTMLPLAYLQFRLGEHFWPARGAEAGRAFDSLRTILEMWNWSAPLQSQQELFAAIGRVGLDVLGPLGVGVAVSGLAMAAAAYPVTVIGVWSWRRTRRRRYRRLRTILPPLALPGAKRLAPTFAESLARYAWAPGHFTCADSVKLLVDGREAYPEMLAAIDAARERVELESYILRADHTGTRFQRALCRAARRGVRVRLLYDFLGSFGLPDGFVQALLGAGVAVRVYHPLVLLRPTWAVNRRDHRKILLVDRRRAFTGGLNISDDCAPPEEGGQGWRDTHMRIDGSAAGERLGILFDYGWANATPYHEAATRAERLKSGLSRQLDRRVRLPWRWTDDIPPITCAPDHVAVQIIGNEEFRHRRIIRRVYLHAIEHAERYILIENAYFIPDRGVRRALAQAVRRGVLVAVAVARHNDVPVAALASRSLYADLLASGVRLFEWPLSMLHAKTAVIDDVWAIVGSYNFDHRSLLHQLEAVAVVVDVPFATRLRDQTLADMARSHEITLAEHEARPWSRMLVESAAYTMHYWL